MLRRIVVLALAFGVIGASALPALAAAPSNDTIGGAVAAALGDNFTVDTTQATTDGDDAQLNATCGAPATDASVWYTVAGTDTGVIVDVSSSDYSAGVLVGVGTPGNLETWTCGPGTVGFFAASGETYYVLAIDDQFDGGGNGGTLHISFQEAPPPPSIDISVNKYGTVNSRTGIATLSGTYSCTNGDFIDVFGDVRQAVGRFSIQGYFEFFDFGTCDGTTYAWTALVYPSNGKFAGGKAATVTFGFACGVFECRDSYVEQTVQLRGGRK